jgi:hypothetical protein
MLHRLFNQSTFPPGSYQSSKYNDLYKNKAYPTGYPTRSKMDTPVQRIGQKITVSQEHLEQNQAELSIYFFGTNYLHNTKEPNFHVRVD